MSVRQKVRAAAATALAASATYLGAGSAAAGAAAAAAVRGQPLPRREHVFVCSAVKVGLYRGTSQL